MNPQKLTERNFKRFAEKFNRGGVDECWEWLAGKNRDGYGLIKWDKTMKRANRISWVIHNGNIPDGLQVLHTCDNPACVNPNHLFLGTPKVNSDDKIKKGRHINPAGENNGKSVLTQSQADEIRLLYTNHNLTQCEIAKRYGVHQTVISRIVRDKSYKLVT